MNPEPPRLKHNRELAAAYIASSGNPPRHPKVSEQVECLPLEHFKLLPNGYNPTIIDDNGHILMCYRFHNGTPATQLAVATISETGEVLSSQVLNLDGEGSFEDAKLFRREGGLSMSFVHSEFPKKLNAIVKYGTFDATHTMLSNQLMVQPSIGKNDGSATEKNWVFWEQEGELFCLYQTSPVQRVFQVEDGKGIPLAEIPGPLWPYGEIRGGTAPVEYDGKLLRFFHSRLWNDLTPPHFRYYTGACLMESKPPFTVVRVSCKPVIYGSEVDDLTLVQRKACEHWKQNVVFPGGAMVRNGYWILALGSNDSACMLAKIKPENLNL